MVKMAGQADRTGNFPAVALLWVLIGIWHPNNIYSPQKRKVFYQEKCWYVLKSASLGQQLHRQLFAMELLLYRTARKWPLLNSVDLDENLSVQCHHLIYCTKVNIALYSNISNVLLEQFDERIDMDTVSPPHLDICYYFTT